MTELMDRITVDQEQCDGRPCIRSIRVGDVLDLLEAISLPRSSKRCPTLSSKIFARACDSRVGQINYSVVAA